MIRCNGGCRPFELTGVTTSQQPRYGRHARLDEPAPSVPAPRPSGVAVRPHSPGEYVTQAPESSGPAFGEWPYGGARRPDPDEPVGPNPYLPCEDAAPEVRMAPGGLPGTLALLAGLVGLGLALFPVVAIAVWPLTILGIVLGAVGLRRIRAGSARNRVSAVLGIVLSVVGLVLCVSWLSMYAAAGVGSAESVQDAVPSLVQ